MVKEKTCAELITHSVRGKQRVHKRGVSGRSCHKPNDLRDQSEGQLLE